MAASAKDDTFGPGPGTQLLNLLKVAGEVLIVPGTSLLMQGKVPQGATHALLGVLSRVALGTVGGTIGWLVLAANSYAKSSSGVYLHDYLIGAVETAVEPKEVEVKEVDVDIVGTAGSKPAARKA